MTDKIELKPCPFCGKSGYSMPRELVISNNKSKTVGWVCGCVSCDVHVYGDAQLDTEKKWNKRPCEEELEAENAKLRKALIDLDVAVLNLLLGRKPKEINE